MLVVKALKVLKPLRLFEYSFFQMDLIIQKKRNEISMKEKGDTPLPFSRFFAYGSNDNRRTMKIGVA